MAHRYGEAILIRQTPRSRRAPGGVGVVGAPAAFLWRNVWYQVDELLATWRLRDRWWSAPLADVVGGANMADAATPGGGGGYASGAPRADALPATERTYYRVLCRDPEGEQVFDLYFDAAIEQWVLDRVHD